jgi:translocation and assembly module TamB
VVDFSWDLARPGFQDVGFERSSGRGRLADQVIELERAALSSGGRSISAEGRIPLAASAEHGGEPSAGHELDLRISADDFRLAGLTKLPPGLKRLDGRLTINLAVRGPMDAPVPEGTITLRDGIVSGFDLDRPIRDIGFEIGARGGTVVLERASAKLGDGAVTATGFVDVGAGKEPTFWLRTKLESAEVSVEDSFDARFAGMLTWAGALRGSEVSGRVLIEKLDVTYPIGLIDLLTRRRGAVMVRRPSAALSRISLDVDIDVEDEINVRNDLARLALKGGFHVDGTALAPEISGGLYTDGGTFTYLDNRFEIETLDVTYVDPTRRDPRVLLVGTSTVTDQSEEEYLVTVRFEGFAFETLPQLSSDPPLTQGDIVALLTFGNTFGGLAAGAGDVGSSGDRFSQLARGAFVSSLFGVAEVALERMLRLDTVSVEQQDGAEGEIVGADLTVGKVFADRLRVNYTTAVGEFGDQEIEVALRLSRRISIETRADPEGNHGIGLRLRLPFK